MARRTPAFLRLVPFSLVGLRLVLGPVLLFGAAHAWTGAALVSILSVGVLSDIFDGVIARRLGVATPVLRQADSAVDIVFWLCVLGAAQERTGGLIMRYGLLISILFFFEVMCQLLSFARFRRPPATHTFAAKLWGLMLFLGFALLLIPVPADTFIRIVFIFGIAVDIEVLAIMMLSSTQPIDVPSVFALRPRRVKR